jgi:hypothetical protein
MALREVTHLEPRRSRPGFGADHPAGRRSKGKFEGRDGIGRRAEGYAVQDRVKEFPAAAARAWSLTNLSAYAETSGKPMSIPPAVPLNWLSRAKIHITPIDDNVVFDEQQTIDLYFRSGLIKQKLNAADIVDRSFSNAIGKGAGL